MKKTTKNNLWDYHVSELKQIAKGKGLSRYSSLRKSELIKLIQLKKNTSVKRRKISIAKQYDGNSYPKTFNLPRGTLLVHISNIDDEDFFPRNEINWFSTDPKFESKFFGNNRYTYEVIESIDQLLLFDHSGEPEAKKEVKKFERYAKQNFGFEGNFEMDSDMKVICKWGYKGFFDTASVGGKKYPDVILCRNIVKGNLRLVNKEYI